MNTKRKIQIEKEFLLKNTGYRALLFEAKVKNSPTSDELKDEIDSLTKKIECEVKIEDINKLPSIAATRKAYKNCGKDPNRYRPSQEQLMRRIVRGLGIYNVNSLVDTGNVLSLKTGCSVGCFDADKIKGINITLGIGKEGEPYHGIGRGEINIAGLPVFRDEIGGIGTPTSDNERTKISLDTTNLLVTVHIFDSQINIDEIVNLFTYFFTRYGEASEIKWELFS